MEFKLKKLKIIELFTFHAQVKASINPKIQAEHNHWIKQRAYLLVHRVLLQCELLKSY